MSASDWLIVLGVGLAMYVVLLVFAIVVVLPHLERISDDYPTPEEWWADVEAHLDQGEPAEVVDLEVERDARHRRGAA